MDDSGDALASGRKEDVSLPKATMTKVIKEMLPREVRVGRGTQDLLGDCCLEFIALLSSEANEVCSKEEKKTIAPEHILEALKNLGFTQYLPEVQDAYEQHKQESLESPRPSGRLSSRAIDARGGMSEEEAIAEQQKMFAAARAEMGRLQDTGALGPLGEQPHSEGSQGPSAPG